MGLVYKIAKWSVNRLIKKGVNLSGLVTTTIKDSEVKNLIINLNDGLNELQEKFSLKRAEIIVEQTKLINEIEPTYITMLAESKDGFTQTTMTKHWVDYLGLIDQLVYEHECLISEFNEKHEHLKKIEDKYEI
jgi:hypothetical protein